jgi:cytochrome d ubiquinol oxidase subunit II
VETLWFIIVAFMITAYVVLDGFDLGAGILHLFVARTDSERRVVLRAIGPVWDGNEVWLLAAGGTLYFAFPQLYSSSFSGFYLPLMMVLWLLMLRGVSVELRGHVGDALWHSFFDTVFFGSSLLLAIFFGTALGNVIRGVPLNPEGYFFEPLWTTFMPEGNTGILDWYTVLAGVVALVALTAHAANYLAAKTEGDVNIRARRISAAAGWVLLLLTIISLVATLLLRPELIANYRDRKWGVVFPLIVSAALAGMFYYLRKGQDLRAFLSSSAFIIAMLGGTAFALYPKLLPATTGDDRSLNIYNSAAGHYGLGVGLIWWSVGIVLALGYFTYLYRSFRGKVSAEGEAGY